MGHVWAESGSCLIIVISGRTQIYATLFLASRWYHEHTLHREWSIPLPS